MRTQPFWSLKKKKKYQKDPNTQKVVRIQKELKKLFSVEVKFFYALLIKSSIIQACGIKLPL